MPHCRKPKSMYSYDPIILCGKKNTSKNILLAFFLVFCSFTIHAATVDTVSIYSKAMNKEYKCVVILPAQYESAPVPVVYLLHGFGGWYSNWITRVPDLTKYAD